MRRNRRVSVADVPTYASVLLIVSVLGTLACIFPALRATRVDPIQAMRID